MEKRRALMSVVKKRMRTNRGTKMAKRTNDRLLKSSFSLREVKRRRNC